MSDEPPVRPPTGYPAAYALCESKVTNSATGEYYHLLFLPPATRTAAVALHAFWLEVREINEECSDREVARVKLAWWHEEIHAMFGGQARHPIAVALAPAVTTHHLPEEAFLAIIATLAQHATMPEFRTFELLRAYGADTRGRLESLVARVAGCHETAALEQAADLGALLELVTLLLNLGGEVRRECTHLPQDDLVRFAVTVDDLRAGKDNEAVRALLRFAANRLATELEQSMRRAHAPHRTSLVSLLAGAKAAQALLKRITAEPTRVLHERVQLMPLRQLWMAWRNARQVRVA